MCGDGETRAEVEERGRAVYQRDGDFRSRHPLPHYANRDVARDFVAWNEEIDLRAETYRRGVG